MKWDEIPAAEYKEVTGYLDNLEAIKKNSNARIAEDTIFTLIDEKAKLLKEMRDRTEYPMSFEQFSQMKKEQKEASKKYDNILQPIPELTFIVPEEDAKAIAADTTKQVRMEDWQKGLKKDPYLLEAIHILEDLN